MNRRFFFLMISAAALTLVSSQVVAASPLLSMEMGYIYTPMEGSEATAGYGMLINTSTNTLEITGLRSKSFKASEIHETKEDKGLMRMRKLAKLTLKPGERFELKPGGNHLMFFEPTSKIKTGDSVTLTFEIAGPAGGPAQTADITVKAKPRPTGP